MCGRYAVTSDTPSMYGLFSIPEPPTEDEGPREEPSPRYNIAPTTVVPVVLERLSKPESPEAGAVMRQLDQMRWGLVPSWAKDPSVGSRMFNARAESVQEKPAFKTSFERRRCLIPANGYFEWQKAPGAAGSAAKSGAAKQAYYMTPDDGSVMAFAGLWSFWRSPDGEPLRSCTIITTDAVGELIDIHDRMPLILPAADWDYWLDPEADPAELGKLLAPPEEALVRALELRPVSNRVGNVRNDDPSLLDPVEAVSTEPPADGLFPL
ncbi:SOS response-associated peptidase [Nakamurella silvestris]|nr:SOS response-associated peptidase [Nakamurella silvestris]